ncbi:MAG TPA: HAMP domain-containing sensor histidine kinase [Chthoniobacterales bacterium]|nr:HAMP domain-containing sensor histidine kinase [Chthoniobacterales bacterium]
MEEKVQPANVQEEGYTADYYASLIVGLIHKLNNVITVLSGHSGLLLLEPNLKPDILQPLQQMSRAAELLSRCLDEAASVSRNTPLRLESVALSELFESLESPPGLSMVKQCDERLKVLVDRRKAKEIFEQILRNASEANAKAVVVTARVQSVVELKFRDDGHGMKTEVMRRAFDPFFTTRRQREQFGLGLFKARGDLTRMKGRIYAESDGKSYTELVVELPVG